MGTHYNGMEHDASVRSLLIINLFGGGGYSSLSSIGRCLAKWAVFTIGVASFEAKDVRKYSKTRFGVCSCCVFENVTDKYMGVSKNKGTPKCMVYNGKPY